MLENICLCGSNQFGLLWNHGLADDNFSACRLRLNYRPLRLRAAKAPCAHYDSHSIIAASENTNH